MYKEAYPSHPQLNQIERFSLLKQGSLSDLSETANLASSIYRDYIKAKKLRFLLLRGALGSGKTTFLHYLANEMNFKDSIKSPSFSLLHIYENDDFLLYHYDLYRVKTKAEIEELGFDEFWTGKLLSSLGKKTLVHAVEWPDIAFDFFPWDAGIFSLEWELSFSSTGSSALDFKELHSYSLKRYRQ